MLTIKNLFKLCILIGINECTEGLECPLGSSQVGNLNDVAGGCGLEDCNTRYDKNSIEECLAYCQANANCLSFSWSPIGGDQNHLDQTVCSIQGTDTVSQQWGPSVISCKPDEYMEPLECPLGSTQVGNLNEVAGGCGLDRCGKRYNKNSIEECLAHCKSNPNCVSFSWSPIGGDQNHLDRTVCSIRSTDTVSLTWGPNVISCKLEPSAGEMNFFDYNNNDIYSTGYQYLFMNALISVITSLCIILICIGCVFCLCNNKQLSLQKYENVDQDNIY